MPGERLGQRLGAAPATVTGDMAPARMNGVISVAWFASA